MKPKQLEKNKKASCRPTQNNWHEMNRQQRREMTRKIQSEDLSLEVVHPDAAGIDIGNESHYVAVPPTRDSQPVRRSLEGNWQEDLLFVLQQEQDGYEFCQKQMAECDQRLQQYLQQQEDRSHGASLPEEKRKERLRKKKKGNAPQFDLRAELFRVTGTDLTQIDGIDVTTTMTILSEAGRDMSKWKTEHHFVSWLRLCPDNRISGDKIIGKGRLPTNNRLTNALRMAASTLRLSNTYLGAQFRRLRTKLGAPVAVKAMAAKLARLVYRMLRYGMTFIDRGAEFYDAQHRKLQINYLKRKAANLGLQIIEAPAA